MNLDEAIEQVRQMTADSTCDINNEKDIGQYHAELPVILAAMMQAKRELESAEKVVEAAADVNDWLKRTDREGTAHQQLLQQALAQHESKEAGGT